MSKTIENIVLEQPEILKYLETVTDITCNGSGYSMI